MIYNTIQYVVDNGIGTLTFNRPAVANGFNIEMCKEILEVLDKAHNDESVRALLINAEGKVFSAGGDLTEMERAVNEGDTESLFEIVELVAEISMAMKKLPKPVIMSLQGAAAGAAFNMALAADFVVAANNVRFIQAFVNVGLAPDAGGLFAQSYRVMKEMMWNSFLAGWEEYKKFEVENQCALGLSEDFKEGVRAFTERRRPKFGQQ
ncbi:MAG: enoyl-CoA hydratase-related protein [Veillonella sp.]|nr:enoyl-CoA hydratase-related protein [Veillonella sp.]